MNTVPIGAAAGAVVGVVAYLRNPERKAIEAQYTELIKICTDELNDLRSVLDDGEELQKKLKQIVKRDE